MSIEKDTVDRTRLYFEPSILLNIGGHTWGARTGPAIAGTYLHRLALGLLIGLCGRDPRAGARLHVGVAAYLTSIVFDPQGITGRSTAGAGVELEIDRPITRRYRVGAKLGLDTVPQEKPGAMVTVGGRLHVRDAVWFGLDVWHRLPGATEVSCLTVAVEGCAAPTTGVMVGIGIEGRPGAITAGLEIGIGALVVLPILLRGTN